MDRIDLLPFHILSHPASLVYSSVWKTGRRNRFQKYDCNNQIPWISEIIKNLKTYQKVILHQGSHDQIGSLPVISSKEIAITLDLMRKLEEIAKRNSSSFPYFIWCYTDDNSLRECRLLLYLDALFDDFYFGIG